MIDEFCIEELLSVLDERLYSEGVTETDREEDIDYLVSDGRDWLIEPIAIVRERHENSCQKKEVE